MSATYRLPKKLQGNKELEDKLRQVAEAVRLNPLHAYNNPELSSRVHRKQLEFNRVQVPPMGTKAMIAGGRSGKTYCCLADDVIQLVPREEVPPHLLDCKKFEGPIDIWIGAPKYSKHEDTILPLLSKLIPKSQLKKGSFDSSYSSQSRKLELLCGSNVFFKTYDQDVDAWASAAVHRIHWDEEPNNANGRRMRAEARQRLLSTRGDELLGMTPILGISTWANDEVYERRHEPGIVVHNMSMTDNPWNTPEDVEAFLDGLTPQERRAREHGEFVHFGGLFFEEFRESLHVVDPPEVKKIRGQEIVVSIDPGLVHTGVTFSAWDSDNAGLFFSEFSPPKTNVPEIALEIKRRIREWQLPEPVFVLDPSYRNLTTDIHADEVQANYAREGIYAQPGNNSRRAGILEIKKRLQAAEANGTPHPTLLVARAKAGAHPLFGCPELIRQTERYRRNPDAADEWQAVPQDEYTRFDLVDSMRYAVMTRTWEEAAAKPKPSYEYGHEPDFDPDEFLLDPAPMGDMS